MDLFLRKKKLAKQQEVWEGKTCKNCGKEMQGLVSRLKQHYHECAIFIDSTDDASADLCILNPDIQVLLQGKHLTCKETEIHQVKYD